MLKDEIKKQNQFQNTLKVKKYISIKRMKTKININTK